MDRSTHNRVRLVTAAVVISLAAHTAATMGNGQETEQRRPPNVIIVMTDDQGYGDLSCHGNPVLRTPHLDRLYNQSLRLTDFHAAPVCTPTRGQLLTGQDAFRNGATFVCMGRSLIRRGVTTMADVFKANGYQTGHFGKWHLGENHPYRPQDRGFTETVHHPAWGITSAADYFNNDYIHSRFRHNGVIQQYEGYCTDVWFDEAIDWVKSCSQRNQPFFVFLATNSPHWPYWVEDQYRTPYRHLKENVASFLGMIANIDMNMGKLERFLSENGLRENTILIFMGDNGTAEGETVFNAGMRGKKATLYEGGHRVPFFLRWPAGRLQTSRDMDELAHCQDVLPTLIDLCDLSRGAPQETELDGISLAGLLRGIQDRLPDRTLVVQYGEKFTKWNSAVLYRKWRLIKGRELYDLRSDTGQENDIASQRPDVTGRLRDHYERWWTRLEPQVSEYRHISIGSDAENPVRLSSCDWAGSYCDNPGGIRGGQTKVGTWHIRVEWDGTYEFTLRRWPQEAGLPIRAGSPVFQGMFGQIEAGRAFRVADARLTIGDVDVRKPVGKNDQSVSFTIQLPAGKTQLRTFFYDGDGKQLCGAYYATVRHIESL